MRRKLLLAITMAILGATMDYHVLAGQGGDVRNGTGPCDRACLEGFVVRNGIGLEQLGRSDVRPSTLGGPLASIPQSLASSLQPLLGRAPGHEIGERAIVGARVDQFVAKPRVFP